MTALVDPGPDPDEAPYPAVTARWPVGDDFAAAHGVQIEQLVVSGETWGLLFHPASVTPPPCPLTLQQVAVLGLAAEGFANSEIGDQLGIGLDTVKTHLRGAFKRLEAADRAHAVLIAMRHGWLT